MDIAARCRRGGEEPVMPATDATTVYPSCGSMDARPPSPSRLALGISFDVVDTWASLEVR